MTVAENRTDKQIDADMTKGDNSLMIWAMGTARGRMQMDPGTCFHPGCVISHTQYACTVNMTHIRTKHTATPEDKGLAQRRKDVEEKLLIHSRIFLCSRQGVIRTTVNTIEILAPLLNNKPRSGLWGRGSSPDRRVITNDEDVGAGNSYSRRSRSCNPPPAINL